MRSKARSYFLIGADHEDIVQEGISACTRLSATLSTISCLLSAPSQSCASPRQIITAIKTATRQKHIPLTAMFP